MYDWQCGMSVRATEAYDAGEKPLSKITKVDLARAGLPDMGLAFAKFLASESSEDLFDFQDQPIWDNSSWHHTSSYYSETKFYRAEDLAIVWNDLEPEEQGKLIEEYERQRQSKSDAASRRVKGTYAQWGGTRSHPVKFEDKAFTGVLRGRSIYLDGGGRKLAGGNHISWSYCKEKETTK